jgi:hypothetical protein
MQQDGVRGDRQVGSGDGLNDSFADHADGPVNDGRGVVDNGAWLAARDQGAVCLVGTVRDAHDAYGQVAGGGGVGEFAVLRKDNEVGADACGRVSHCPGVVRTGGHQVAQASVRCEVYDGGAMVGGEGAEGSELVQDVVTDFICGEVHGAAAEAAQVREARVRPDADAAAHALRDRGVHDVRVPCVEAAGDVGAGHYFQEGRVVAQGVRAKAFSKICNEINDGSHMSPPWGWWRSAGQGKRQLPKVEVCGPAGGGLVPEPGLPGL